jgi:hypothetical protein
MPPGHPPVPDRTFIAYIAGVGRAGAVVRGLLRAGRARPMRIAMLVDTGEFVRLERRPAPGWYWIARDGGHVRVGRNFATAEQLQPGFLEAMERAGAAQARITADRLS